MSRAFPKSVSVISCPNLGLFNALRFRPSRYFLSGFSADRTSSFMSMSMISTPSFLLLHRSLHRWISASPKVSDNADLHSLQYPSHVIFPYMVLASHRIAGLKFPDDFLCASMYDFSRISVAVQVWQYFHWSCQWIAFPLVSSLTGLWSGTCSCPSLKNPLLNIPSVPPVLTYMRLFNVSPYPEKSSPLKSKSSPSTSSISLMNFPLPDYMPPRYAGWMSMYIVWTCVIAV